MLCFRAIFHLARRRKRIRKPPDIYIYIYIYIYIGEDGAPGVEQISGPPKLSFPIPGSMDGVKSGSWAVLEAKNLAFRYSVDKDYLIKDASPKLSLNSRVAVCRRNGVGRVRV
jgi:hypothetical protein